MKDHRVFILALKKILSEKDFQLLVSLFLLIHGRRNFIRRIFSLPPPFSDVLKKDRAINAMITRAGSAADDGDGLEGRIPPIIRRADDANT